MYIQQWKQNFVLLLISFIGKYNSTPNKQHQWTWDCVEGQCKRHHTSEIPILQTLETCKMLCGPDDNLFWPEPTEMIKLSKVAVMIKLELIELKILESPSSDVTQHIKEAFFIFINYLGKIEEKPTRKAEHEHSYPMVVEVFVNISGSKDPKLLLNTDEGYQILLKIKKDIIVAKIRAQSFPGVHNALETLSQLIWYDNYEESLLIFNDAHIKDSPAFLYRGFMLDTARNFFPVSDILRTIDGMAANKLNTFHWHISDSNSFPLQLKSLPLFVEYGSYSRKKVYTVDDVVCVVNYAKIRGIRVLIEIDAPAHVGKSWRWTEKAGLGELALKVEATPWINYCGQPPCGQLNPRNPQVYRILKKMYAEIIKLTGVSDIFHIGGDEVSPESWSEFENISDSMNLWLDFTQQAIDALKEANKGSLPLLTVIWSSKMTTAPYSLYLNKSSVAIQVWSDSQSTESTQTYGSGFFNIISHIDKWYLDCGFGSWRDTSRGHCPGYNSWSQMYEFRPWSESDKNNIIGGETCMWSEMVGPGGLDARVWPRAAAVAARLWSDPIKDAKEMFVRLDTHRSRMLARGIQVSPLWPEWCSQNPDGC